MGEIKDVFENKLYDTKDFWTNVTGNVPFIQVGETKLDGFGRDINKYDREEGMKGIADGLKYAVTRRFYNPSRGTELDAFLWANQIKVSPPQNTVKLAYTEEDYRAYIVRRGQIAMEQLQARIKANEFKDMSPLQIEDIVNDVLKEANLQAQLEINEQLGRKTRYQLIEEGKIKID
jgi:hypothetical protein